jgi:glutamyl-tRNA synthetase
MTVRTRFAPSPTGSLHIGGVRTSLYCFALSRKHGGKFIVRIEDTDQKRFVPGSIEEIMYALNKYSLEADEGPETQGGFGPYIQSERLDLYRKYVEELVAKGGAYYCFLTAEEEEQLRASYRADKAAFRSPYRNATPEETAAKLAAGEKYVIRQKIPENETIEFVDGVQGHMKFSSNEVDEGVLLKSDGFPTYHLAMLVDDHLMEISHVFRDATWIPSIPKHVLLYRTMGWEIPPMFHLSAILDPAGGKLSKRRGAVAAMEFLRLGYLPEAVLNFLMLLGWSSPLPHEFGESQREIFSLQEFIELFDTKDLNKSNPIFDRTKLLWFNQKYINALSVDEFTAKFKDWAQTAVETADQEFKVDEEGDEDAAVKAEQYDVNAARIALLRELLADSDLATKLNLVQTRVKILSEIPDSLAFFYSAPQNVDWGIKQLEKVPADKLPELKAEITVFMVSLGADASAWKHEDWEAGIRAIADKHEIKHGDAFMILRMAVVGSPFSPPLFESLQILGLNEILIRLT